ncbi:restriction endonuclease subunit S [Kingella negevensis]|uniref:restriction endonuclease subunit S n=1 Tax=Kingella negevensis TaxID=1522312 RepID=UPI00255060C5|nr:restriction endonuclease subunit S [Kingella negevensis]MDK4680247.1 restriction endonuclease subunit S [Kingella negevensis]
MENAFLASGGEFVFKKVGSLFDINPTKNYGLTNDDLFREKGTTPVVVNSSINNGIGGYVARKPTETGNIITFSDTTTSDSIFYQPNDFIGYSHVQGMKPKNHHEQWNKHTLHYFVAIFRAATKGLFNYGNKFNRENAREIEVCLPEKNGEIAFDYMERFVQQLRAERAQELRAFLKLSNLTDVNLSKDEENALAQLSGSLNWKMFNLKELFGSATRGKRLKSDDRISGSLPFVTAGEASTGISAFIGNSVDVFKSNTVTIDMFGSAKYRNYEYGADDHIAVVHTDKIAKHAVLFATAAMHKVANAGQFSYSRNFYAKDADELNIMLPEKDGEPDWEFMALIGRAIEKCVIADVVAFNEREMAAYEQVIYS